MNTPLMTLLFPYSLILIENYNTQQIGMTTFHGLYC
jgi:hypothetical protein